MKATKSIDLMSKTVALIVTFSGVGNRRKVSTSQVEVEADKAWINVSKKLLEADEYDAIGHLDSEIKGYLDTRALPSLLKRGIYLLPIPMVEEVNEKLKAYVGERQLRVEKFIAVYKQHVREAKDRLQALFCQSDYSSAEQIRAEFSLTWQFTSFNTPASLNQISRELYEAEKAKAEANWQDAQQTIQQLLRTQMAELVTHLTEKLTTGEDGKKKIFRNTSVTKLQEFLSTFDLRNVSDDAQLKALVDKARKLIEGVDANQLRSEEALRDSLKNGFAKIQNAMSGMIEVKPKRAISLEDVA